MHAILAFIIIASSVVAGVTLGVGGAIALAAEAATSYSSYTQ